MKTELAQLLMNRALDGAASAGEREQLASAMRADPLLRQEFEELQATHVATQSLFRQLDLPRDFSKRVMKRVQGHDVPSDEHLRLPERRPLKDRKVRLAKVQRNRVRLYASIAAVSAAASILLLVGVFSGFFVRNGIGTVEYVPPEGPVADGRQGVPDSEGYNRTDPSTRPPDYSVDNGGSSEPTNVGNGTGNVKDNPVVEEQPAPENQPDPESGETVKTPEKIDDTPEEVIKNPEPESTPEEVVKEPNSSDEPESTPEVHPQPKPEDNPVVEDKPENNPPAEEPVEQPKETVAVEKPVIGQVSVLSGHVYRQDGDDWVKLKELDEVREGMYLRTSRSGIAMLNFDAGVVTLGGKSEAALDSSDSFSLVEGEAAMERNTNASGHSFEMVIDSHRLIVTHGNVFVERGRRGFEVCKPFGFATITHDELGSILLEEDAAYTAEVEFDAEIYEMPAVQEMMLLPTYAAETRAQLVMEAIKSALADRDFRRDERAYVEGNIPGELEDLMVHPVACASVIDFMLKSVENTNLVGRDLVNTIDEVLGAMIEFGEIHSSDDIAGFAANSALVAENYNNWKEYFYRQLRPAPKQPVQTPPTNNGSSDCPNEKDKLKRVEKQPVKRKVIKKSTPQNPDGDDEEDEKKPSS